MEGAQLKNELLDWIRSLDDDETLEYLKKVKESHASNTDWWHTLSEAEKSGIQRGQADAEAGRVIDHETVKAKYGL